VLARIITVLGFFVFSSLGFCQQPGHHSSPNATGSRLIAWSELQKPQPVPQAIPEQIRPLANVFTGVISNGRGYYTLNATDSSEYVIDNSEQVLDHLGTGVRVFGAIDANTGRLYVLTISGQ
jgi:hypothetical protein